VTTTIPTPVTPHPAPVVPTLPSSFTTAEEYLAHEVAVVEAFLTGRSLPFLQKIQAWADAGALPLGLEKYRTQVLSFLSNAIAYAEDVVAVTQMLEHLGLADKVAVASGVATETNGVVTPNVAA
jgi:hypothetical protein